MSDQRHVFISYSHRDDVFVENLYRDVKDAGVSAWIDKDKLAPGTRNYERKLKEALSQAYAVAYVVSPNSYESDYVQGEIAVAQRYGCEIYPLWINGDEWVNCVPIDMAKWLYIDFREDYKKALQELIAALNGKKPEYAAPARTFPTPTSSKIRNPYKGLNAFKEEDSSDFFGREALSQMLFDTIESQLSKDEPRFITVVGASGGGKSSVVMAGLLPKLRENGMKILSMIPSKRPLENLADAIVSSLSLYPSAVDDYLTQTDGRGLYRMLKKDEKILLFVDQFEEVFTLTETEEERAQFINLLTTAATEIDGSITLILTMRADYIVRVLNYSSLSDLFQSRMTLIKNLSLIELLDAIEKPAALAGLTFEVGLVPEMVFQLRDKTEALSGALPLLQFTLDRLYELREGTTLTRKAYDDIGGVQGAIGNHADTVFAKYSKDIQEALLRILYHLVTVDENGAIARQRTTLSRFVDDEAAQKLINVLINSRLLVSDTKDDERYVEVAHEALFTHWERLKTWIEPRKDDLKLQRKVEIAAREWDVAGRPEYLLWLYEIQQPVFEMQKVSDVPFTSLANEFMESELDRLINEFEHHPPDYRKWSIIDRLTQIGKDSVPYIAKLLFNEKNDPMRSFIQLKITQFPDETLELLTPLLRHSRKNVRKIAISTFGKIQDARTKEILIKLWSDSDYDEDVAAIIDSLRELGLTETVDLILAIINDNPFKTFLAGVKLGKLGWKSVIPLLKKIYSIRGSLSPAIALAYLGDDYGIETLIENLNYETFEDEIISALKKLHTSEALEAVRQHQKRKNKPKE